MLPMGLSSAVNTSISNAMGAARANSSRRIFLVALGVAAALQTTIIAGGPVRVDEMSQNLSTICTYVQVE
jgi:hypothetical protein